MLVLNCDKMYHYLNLFIAESMAQVSISIKGPRRPNVVGRSLFITIIMFVNILACPSAQVDPKDSTRPLKSNHSIIKISTANEPPSSSTTEATTTAIATAGTTTKTTTTTISTTEMPSNATAQTQTQTQTVEPTESDEPQLNGMDDNFSIDETTTTTATTTTTTTTIDRSGSLQEAGDSRQALHFNEQDPHGNEIEDRMGLQAPPSLTGQPVIKSIGQPELRQQQQMAANETNSKLTTSTSSYFIDVDVEGDEYGLRQILSDNSIRSQVGDDITTPASVFMSSPIESYQADHSIVGSTISGVANHTNDLQTLETGVSMTTNETIKSTIQPSVVVVNQNPSPDGIDESMTTKSHWSSPLGKRFFVPQTTSISDDNHEDKRLIRDTIIPKANIVDLLHIIKHLNLINSHQDGDLKPPPDSTMSSKSSVVESISPLDGTSQHVPPSQTLGLAEIEAPIAQLIGRTKPEQHILSNIDRSPVQGGRIRLGTVKMSRQGYRSDSADTAAGAVPMLASQSSPSGSVEPGQKGPSQRRASIKKDLRSGELDTKFLSRFTNSVMETTLGARKPSRLSLISPYSANFDTGLQALKNAAVTATTTSTTNRASVDNTRDKHSNHSTLSGATNSGLEPRQMNKSSTQIRIGSKPSQTTGNMATTTAATTSVTTTTRNKTKPDHNNKVQTTTMASNNQGGSDQQQRQHRDHHHHQQANDQQTSPSQDGAKRTRTAAASTVHIKDTDSTTEADSNNSKRGERDTNNNRQQAPYLQLIPLDENANANRMNKQSQSTETSNNNNNGNLSQPDPNGTQKKGTNSMNSSPSSDSDSLPRRPFSNIINNSNNNNNRQTIANGNGFEPMVPKLNYHLDDPHKKSYYWSPEQSDLTHVDDFGLSSMDQFPKPLTIADLARYHGVNPFFGLPKPSTTMLMNDLKLDQLHQSSEDFGLFSESGLQEDYAQFSPMNQNHVIVGGGDSIAPNDNKSALRLSDELKQNIAVKAFEAAMRDPDLSATLFGNLLNMNAVSGGGIGLPGGTVFNHQHLAGAPNHLSLEQVRPVPANYHTAGAPFLNKSNRFNLASSNPLVALAAGPNPLQLRDHLSRPNNPFNLMMPMATTTSMRDQVPDTSPLQHQAINPTAHRGTGSDAQSPVNLVITDLANRWALSRMPDLVPIPLAATVPGYLIRLPNGKILAAALTNMFSIEGIQREPLNGSYKNMVNNRFKGVVKGSDKTKMIRTQFKHQNTYANLASDSGLMPTIVTPVHHLHRQHAQHSVAQPKSRLKTNKNHNDKGVGSIFPRGVMNQLNLMSAVGGTTKSHIHHLSRHTGVHSNNKPMHGQRNNGIANKSKMVKLIQNLPIADPSEPVFSFADESELIDEPDYNMPANPSPPHLNYVRNLRPPANDLAASEQSIRLEQSTEASENDGKLAELKNKLNHLLSIRHTPTLTGDELFQYGRRKRKSPPRFAFAKLEPVMNWLTTRRKILTRRDPRVCNEKD